MKKENFKEMSKDELTSKLAHLQESLRVLKFNVQGSKSKNVKESLSIRKEIARILTQMNRKEITN